MKEAISTPDVAVEATLQPIRRFGFDAAILFSDLTIAFDAMGAPYEIKEGVGPVVATPIRSKKAIETLHRFEPNEGLSFVMDTIRSLKRELQVPLIGFTGAPFTLASYLIEGGPSRDLRHTKAMMYSEPALWDRLMAVLSDVVADYLLAQAAAGADALQIFDSWVGALSPDAYRQYLLPHMKHLFARLDGLDIPIIHFGTGNPLLLLLQREAGGSVIGVDFRVSLTDASALVPGIPLQGNLEPAALHGDGVTLARLAEALVVEGRKLPGHIFNLGHGILTETPIRNVEILVETVRNA